MNNRIEEALYAIKDTLEEKVADYLDVNRGHIKVGLIDTDLIGEDCYDWSNNPDDAYEGVQTETYYWFQYQYRADKRLLDYEEPVEMVWQHIEYEGEEMDWVMTPEAFKILFEKKRKDVCSLVWYEGPSNENEY